MTHEEDEIQPSQFFKSDLPQAHIEIGMEHPEEGDNDDDLINLNFGKVIPGASPKSQSFKKKPNYEQTLEKGVADEMDTPVPS